MPTRLVTLAALAWVTATTATAAASPCEEAGSEAEKTYHLPPGLLSAIGRVESGRWDAALGRTAAWPWTIDVAGAGRQFETAAEAVRTTHALRTGGARNIDVGCFQISLLHHPNAFKDLDEAFDPTANAYYAGKFLASLKEASGSWDSAVAAYHSSDPSRGIPYRQQVFARWHGTLPPEPSEVAQPVIAAFGIRIWTPSRAARGSTLIAMMPPATVTTDVGAAVGDAPKPGWRLPRVYSQR